MNINDVAKSINEALASIQFLCESTDTPMFNVDEVIREATDEMKHLATHGTETEICRKLFKCYYMTTAMNEVMNRSIQAAVLQRDDNSLSDEEAMRIVTAMEDTDPNAN